MPAVTAAGGPLPPRITNRFAPQEVGVKQLRRSSHY